MIDPKNAAKRALKVCRRACFGQPNAPYVEGLARA